jgi:hypothetical protein
MLENKKMIIRPGNITGKIHIYFFVSVMLAGLILAVFMPVIIPGILTEQELSGIKFEFDQSMFYHALIGLAVSFVGALAGIKFLSPSVLVNLIKFILLTFIMLSALVYIAMKGE